MYEQNPDNNGHGQQRMDMAGVTGNGWKQMDLARIAGSGLK